MSSDIAARLEAVTARLEKLAKKGFGGGGDDDEDGTPAYVTDFAAIVSTQVAEACNCADAVKANDIRKLMEQAFNNVSAFLKASAACKKPSQPVMMKFLGDAVGAITSAEKNKMKRNKVENHNAAFYELLVSLSWVTMAPPYGMPFQHAEAQKDACEFHLNRILKKFKEDPDKEKHRAFVKSFKAVNQAQCDFVKQYFKTGVEWNGKGGDLAEFSGDTAAAPISAAPAKKKVVTKKKAAGGGVAGMFSELKKKAAGGDSAAKGMKKVTKDMKTKNRKDRTGAVVMKKKKAVVKKPSKPPSMTDRGGKWMIENYWEEGSVVELPEKIKTKENAFIVASQNTTFVIKQKIKAVTIDSCKKCRFFLAGVVSSVELVNCQSVTVFLQGPCPSIQIDKCDSPRIVLMKEAMNPVPAIVTSNVSAGNIEIPGVNPDDDNREMPMPEQYNVTIDTVNAKLTSEPVNHG